MKKKLIIITLVLCCVWGVFASKLTDAAANGDFDTMKKQIELLDYNVKGDWELLWYCLNGWSWYGEESRDAENYKKCIDYLMQNGAVMNYDKKYVSYYGEEYGYLKANYMYKKKYDSVDKIWSTNRAMDYWYTYYVGEAYSRINYELNISLGNALSYDDGCVEILMLLSYNPLVQSHWAVELLSGDLTAIRNRLKNGADYKGRKILLFVNNPKVIELLQAADAYELPNKFDGTITKYLITEIVPKYCTHIMSKEEIAFMKFIANYNSSMDYDKSLAYVKYLITNGLDLNATHTILCSQKMFMLPMILGNVDSVKLLMEVMPISIVCMDENDRERNYNNQCVLKAKNYRGEPIIRYYNQNGNCEKEITISKAVYNDLKQVSEELARIAAEKAEQERIERERKAEEERIAREKKAENDLMTNYLPKFSDNVREILMSYGSVKKGEYKVKSKKFEPLAQKQSLYTVYRIDKNYSAVFIEKTEGKKTEELYSFSLSDGYTIKNVQKVWNKAVDKVCDEFGLQ